MTTFKVGYLVGSLATASINRLLAKALVRLAPQHLDMAEIPQDLPGGSTIKALACAHETAKNPS